MRALNFQFTVMIFEDNANTRINVPRAMSLLKSKISIDIFLISPKFGYFLISIIMSSHSHVGLLLTCENVAS